ncbi:MAG TPA: hypothetical protein VKB79_04055 [Bryobacteraceae bacterium]|nr:hypothetical protein [Bryobacteraceae bacterium]
MPELDRTRSGGGPDGVDQSAYEEQIAQLERVIAEKERAVMRAVLSATEVQQQLETSQAESRALIAQLELVRDRPTPAALGEEVGRISAQFAQARRSLDREREQSQAEAIAVKARLQQARQQLDHERQMRRADSAAHSATIASLQRDLAGARARAGAAQADPPRSIWARLAACALAAALLVSLYVGWLRLSKLPGLSMARRAPAPEAGGAPAANDTSSLRARTPERPHDGLAPATQRTLKQKTTEWKNPDPSVCDFQWTGGLPTILYSGKDSLLAILGRCTQAVENAGAQ